MKYTNMSEKRIDLDDKDLAIIGLVIIFIASIIAMLIAPKDIASVIADKITYVWTGVVTALSGLATGRKKSA